MIKRHDLSLQSESLVTAAGRIAAENNAAAVVMLAEVPSRFVEKSAVDRHFG